MFAVFIAVWNKKFLLESMSEIDKIHMVKRGFFLRTIRFTQIVTSVRINE